MKPRLYPFFRDLLGQARGWDRMRIRREVRGNARRSPGELAERGQVLFRERVEAAIARFPAYAAKVKGHCGLPGPGELGDPAALPIWTRDDQRALFESLGGPPVAGSLVHSTGGSTGVPTRFYITRSSYEWRTAVSDRGYSWAGAEEGRRSYYIWGTPIRAPGRLTHWKQEIHHALQRRTYFDSFSFGDAEKEACCRDIARRRPPVVVGYAGNLIELAHFVKRRPDLWPWKPAAIVTAAEGLAPGRRELIEASLGGRVFMSYGSREFMLIGMECPEHNGYHLASDNLFVEVVDGAGQPARPGEPGRILVTDLHNEANPFVRYEIGDLGTLFGPEHRCACGLPFPLLATVEGRLQEVILTKRGERVTALFVPHLMKEFPWVEGYQLSQERAGAVTVSLITQGALRPELTAQIAEPLRGRLGDDMELRFERVERLVRNRSGKTPIVIAAGGAQAAGS